MAKRGQELKYAILIALLIGFLDSAFLTYKHFFEPLSICGVGLFSDCGTVLQSKYSVMWGIPLAVWGIVQYLVVLALYGISQFIGSRFYKRLLFIQTAFGFLFSLYFLYIGNYLPAGHPYFKKTQEELLRIYDPYLKKLNPKYAIHVQSVTTFPVAFAQPIVTTHFSKKIMPMTTPFKHVYLANMQQVYPWDRGTNFAVEMGKDVARYISGTV